MKLIDKDDYKQIVANINRRHTGPVKFSWLYMVSVVASIGSLALLYHHDLYSNMVMIWGATMLVAVLFDYRFRLLRHPDQSPSLYRLIKEYGAYVIKLSIFSVVYILLYVFIIEEVLLKWLDSDYDINKSGFGKAK